MNPDRQFWNKQQQVLRKNLARTEFHEKAKALFLNQHSMVHSSVMSNSGHWSFEDEALDGVNIQQMRILPRNCEHSIAWLVWHMTRCEDITMNLLVARSPQVLLQENWLKHLKIDERDTGNTMGTGDILNFSLLIDIEALKAYRLAVGRRTREIVIQVQPDRLLQRVDPSGLEQIQVEGAVLKGASGLLDYWGGLTIAGLLLMPPTRHNFVHWNEALRVKKNF